MKKTSLFENYDLENELNDIEFKSNKFVINKVDDKISQTSTNSTEKFIPKENIDNKTSTNNTNKTYNKNQNDINNFGITNSISEIIVSPIGEINNKIVEYYDNYIIFEGIRFNLTTR